MTTLRAQCWIQIEVPDTTHKDEYERLFNDVLLGFLTKARASQRGVIVYRSRRDQWESWQDVRSVEEV